MSDDVILSRAEAANLADFLRHRGIGEHHSLLKRLDPPQPSLREEIAAHLADHSGYNTTSLMDRDAAADILAVVRERMAALPVVNTDDLWVRRDAVLALLGGDEQIVRTAHQWDERGDTVGY